MSPTSLHSLLCLFDPHSTVRTTPCYLSGISHLSPINSLLGRSCMYNNTLQLAITRFPVLLLLHFLGSSCCLFKINSLSLIFLVWYWGFGIEVVVFNKWPSLKEQGIIISSFVQILTYFILKFVKLLLQLSTYPLALLPQYLQHLGLHIPKLIISLFVNLPQTLFNLSLKLLLLLLLLLLLFPFFLPALAPINNNTNLFPQQLNLIANIFKINIILIRYLIHFRLYRL